MNMDDPTATENTYKFLLNWLQLFPELQGRDLWITGESYGGTYIPWISQRILKGEDLQLKNSLKGVMMGNPVMWCKSAGLNTLGQQKYEIQNYYQHGLIPFHTMSEYNAQCWNDPTTQTCQDLFDKATKLVGVIQQQLKFKDSKRFFGNNLGDTQQADLQPDNLYYDFCTGTATLQPNLNSDPKMCVPMSQVQSN